ncbi:MAG TPA: HAMP domain-containing sensor histidine kinase [Candidatus Methylomirabilis sp.]|nr:HAMP domain-containing sensor histidine kinase [Candidatus Methylomirabilis sp.]
MRQTSKNDDDAVIARATADFVAMVSHQLKGPLGAVRAASVMLAAGDYGKLPARARETAVLMSHTTARLLALIDTYLESTKLDLGSIAVRPKPTDLRKELGDLVALMAPLAKLKGLTIMQDVPEAFGRVTIDDDIFANVAFNLIDNAVAYTDQGSILVELERVSDAVVLRVSDTGMGMKPSDAKTLFQRFQRGVMGDDRRHKGTGLGLFLVKRLAEAAGGSVRAESRGPGKGSMFEVRLPVT